MSSSKHNIILDDELNNKFLSLIVNLRDNLLEKSKTTIECSESGVQCQFHFCGAIGNIFLKTVDIYNQYLKKSNLVELFDDMVSLGIPEELLQLKKVLPDNIFFEICQNSRCLLNYLNNCEDDN